MKKDSAHKEYWASVPSKEIADEILDKVDKFYEYLSMTGRLDLYRRSWSYYYRPRVSGGQLNVGGEQGELTTLSVNHYRNLLVHLETMTTQQRAAFEPRAANSDVKSQSQVILATGLLDYYMREKKLERNLKQAVKDCLIFAEGFLQIEWDPTSGDEYGKTETGATIYQGDLKFTNYTPFDVIRDFSNIAPNMDDWFILRKFEPKYTLAAKTPDLADDILSDAADMLDLARTTTLNMWAIENSDNIPTYTLIHRPTPALPQGRYVKCLDNGTVLMDGPIPYKDTNVFRIAPDEESGSIFGFSVGFDLLSMQEGIDILYSTAMTNQATFGVQNVLAPKGHDLSTSQMAGGGLLMEYDPKIGKPEAFQITSTPPEIFNFMGQLEKLMETISGVNSVARGNPEASLKSGAALALVQSMAIQFSMGLQQSFAQLVEDAGTGAINILKDFASVPRVAAIAGKSNRPLMREFSGQDLSGINRVMVDMGNPLTRTTAGKVNLAENLADRNLIENSDQYIQVITTGRLEPVIESKQANNLLIKGENEKLAEGIPQRALITDRHSVHILEHLVVLSSPEAREDPNSPVIQATLAHVQEHINFLKTADPVLLSLIHEQSAMPQGAPSAAPPMNAQAPVQQEAAEVQQPNMPSPPAGADPVSAAIIEQQGAA